jgi:hypothetical protein
MENSTDFAISHEVMSIPSSYSAIDMYDFIVSNATAKKNSRVSITGFITTKMLLRANAI